MRILDAVKEKLRPWWTRENLLPGRVSIILGSHAKNSRVLEDLLPAACEVMNSYIANEGNIEGDWIKERTISWFGAPKNRKACRSDIMTEAGLLVDAIAGSRKDSGPFLEPFEKHQQDLIPFEHVYKSLYDEQKDKADSAGTAEAAKTATGEKGCGGEGENGIIKKKRKRTKKKKVTTNGDTEEDCT